MCLGLALRALRNDALAAGANWNPPVYVTSRGVSQRDRHSVPNHGNTGRPVAVDEGLLPPDDVTFVIGDLNGLSFLRGFPLQDVKGRQKPRLRFAGILPEGSY